MSGPGLEAAKGGGSRAPRRRLLLTAEEAELFELAQAAGTGLDPEVFKILLDLLRMNVAPLAIFQMLRAMCAGQRLSAEATSEPAREPPIVSAKTSKIPAPLSFSSVLRPPRIRVTKAVVYSPAAACSPLSQGPPGSFQFSCCLFSPFAGCVEPEQFLQQLGAKVCQTIVTEKDQVNEYLGNQVPAGYRRLDALGKVHSCFQYCSKIAMSKYSVVKN
ncbi:hypothetical protein JD844_017190 [Phrynosoma platyrhinos]|uniref:Mitotic spindle organizing protein 2B n=1 Tax=Phrynosoma platyrhinos TaxID=52577 RepID=A0ABQ7SLF5_PHRPL|nr:hypothetical protein JD844_017190 [Phrynosoma platyrhinos]